MQRMRIIVIVLLPLLGACTRLSDDAPEPTTLPPLITIATTTTEVASLPPVTLPPTTVAPTSTEPPTTTTEPAPTTSTYKTWVDVLAAESSGVFRINNFICNDGRTSGGTGFLVAPGVIATAAHVVEENYGFTVDQRDGEPGLPANPIAIDLAEDVALLAVPAATGFIFSLGVHEPPAGTTIGLIGFSDGRAPYRPIRGDIGQLNLTNLVYGDKTQFHPRRAFQHSMQTNKGDSGSPILDTETGEVLGVNVAGFTRIQGVNYAVYLDALRTLLAQPPSDVPIDGCNLAASTTPTTAPPPTAPPTTVPPPVTTSPSTTVLAGPLTYQVLLGDTVFGTARAFNTTVDALVAVNGPAILDVLRDKVILRLPADARPLSTTDVASYSYTVKSGDTIIGIAKATGITPAQLLAINGKLSTPDVLSVGQVLRIPQF
ncbi:MAG: LysM peptidoglycan-binding domain-containing protein [Ilumatobacteraceae bacterium]